MRALLLLLLYLIVEEVSAQGPPQFVFDRVEINIHGIDVDINTIAVYIDVLKENDLYEAQKILGQASRYGEQVNFKPIVPLSFDTPYTLAYNDAIKHFVIKLPEGYERLTVVAIHPDSKEIPANLLKWYVEFSRPINPMNIYDYFSIIDYEGAAIERAILPLESALLSEDGKLLTLWMEPGRQKRGLLPNQELGAVLQIGQHYKLQIDHNLKDENGVRMQQRNPFEFKVIKPDRSKPDINRWDISLPSINSKMALLIDMDELMDYGSIIDHVHIYSKGVAVKGQWRQKFQEKQLEFIPINNWIGGGYSVIFDPAIEDLAGNNLLRLFDSHRDDKVDPYTVQTTLDFFVE